MATIRLSYADATASNLAAAREIAHEEMLHNPDWSGAEIGVEAGDFTEVDANDQIAGAMLLQRVIDAISPRD